MKTELTGGGVLALAAVGLVAVGALTLYAKRKEAAAGAVAVIDYINPNSTNNVVYKAVSAPFDAPLGVKLWEWFNPTAVEAEKQATGAIAAPSAGSNQAWGTNPYSDPATVYDPMTGLPLYTAAQ